MSNRLISPKPKGQHRRLLGLLTAVIVVAGMVSFCLKDKKEEAPQEEIVIVDLTAPPPPPPPPMEPEEVMPQPEEEVSESDDVSELDAPDDLSGDSTEDMDLGIDVGELASGTGGGFEIDIPRKFGRKGEGGEDPFGADMDSPPTPVNRMPPQYPSGLLKKGIGGKVVVTCVIDAKGAIISTRIKQSSGQPELDKAALQAVSRWKFKPATRGGKPFQATCNIPFTFEVKKS